MLGWLVGSTSRRGAVSMYRGWIFPTAERLWGFYPLISRRPDFEISLALKTHIFIRYDLLRRRAIASEYLRPSNYRDRAQWFRSAAGSMGIFY